MGVGAHEAVHGAGAVFGDRGDVAAADYGEVGWWGGGVEEGGGELFGEGADVVFAGL